MDKLRETIGMSMNDKLVWYNPVNSHTATHIQDTPQLKQLAAEVIDKFELNETYHQFDKDLGRIVGTSDLVQNQPGDLIVYAKRLNRETYTVFNKTRQPVPSRIVTVALEEQDDESYELVSTWIGPSNSPSFPETERETNESKQFWNEHSLVWGTQDIQLGTETYNCPW